MIKNMISYSKELRKKLLKLVLEIRKITTNNYPKKKRIAYFNEFWDDFNPCNSNNTNNSITLHTLSIIPIDNTKDSNEYAYQVAIEYKHKENILIKIYYKKLWTKW